MATVDVERTTLRELANRGVTNPVEFATLTDEVIQATLDWFDKQNGRVGVGVLVTELRKGGKRPASRRRQEGQGWHDMADWLRAHVPDVCDDRGRPHPAAVLVLWHKGFRNVSVRDVGAVREAVRVWKRDREGGE